MKGTKINDAQKHLYIQKGYWKDKTLLEYWNESVEKYRKKEFVVDDKGKRYTYEDIDKKASILARYFIEKGIKPLDIISYQIPVWCEFIIISIACIKVGAIMNPIGMCYKSNELIYLLNLSKTKIFICPSFFHKTNYEESILSVKEKITNLKSIVIIDKHKKINSSCDNFYKILDNYLPSKHNNRVSSDDVALILYTSGTTGNEKGVMLTHNNIIFSEEYFNKSLNLTEHDIIFMPAPLNHATGFHHGIISPMLLGGKIVLQSKFDGVKAIKLMNKEKCTYSMGSTPFIYDILKVLEDKNENIPSLKFYLCGGAHVPKKMVESAHNYGIKLCEVYGSTESVPHVFVRPNEAIKLMGSTSGSPIEGVEVKVVDGNGKEVKPGIMGEELSRGPNVFVGYLNDIEATNKVLDNDGWYHSGDLCIHDGKGNIKIIGRKKDMIVRGGENLNSNKISEYISSYYKIKDQAIISMPDERLGERICAYIVLEEGFEDFELKELIQYLMDKGVPKRYWPERLEIIENIPRTDSGKIKKYILEEDLSLRMKLEMKVDNY